MGIQDVAGISQRRTCRLRRRIMEPVEAPACGTCIWRPDGWQDTKPQYCYKWDELRLAGETCDEHGESLRAEPVNLPPMVTHFNFDGED